MKQCFRIALWMFCLVVFLQANPFHSQNTGQGNNHQGKPVRFIMADLGFSSLHKHVLCGHNVTFTSPTMVQGDCHTAALKCFKEGLEQARTFCIDDNHQINQTLDALDPKGVLGLEGSQPTLTNSSECKWGKEGYRKQFEAFVNDLKKLVEQINSSGSN